MILIIDDKPNTVQGIVDFLEKENKKITQSERGVRIRLSVAGRVEYESNHIINILLHSILKFLIL